MLQKKTNLQTSDFNSWSFFFGELNLLSQDSLEGFSKLPRLKGNDLTLN